MFSNLTLIHSTVHARNLTYRCVTARDNRHTGKLIKFLLPTIEIHMSKPTINLVQVTCHLRHAMTTQRLIKLVFHLGAWHSI